MTHESRRAFLKALGLGGLGLAGCAKADAPGAQAQTATPTEPAAQPGASRVVIATDPGVMDGRGEIDVDRLRGMLRRAMLALANTDAPADAWAAHFKPDDVVALKINALAGPELSSHPELCRAVADGLALGGVDPNRTIIFDRDCAELEALGFEINTRGSGTKILGTDVVGYDRRPTVIKSVGTCFSRIVSEVATALVNVPVLKDHDLAGLSSALKNHFGSIHNPNKLHLDHCYPFVADLNCAKVIRDKQRLVIVDALVVCYDGGPAFNPEATVPHGALIVTTDPVAADAVGLQIIETLRREHGLAPLMEQDRAPRYIELAESYGLGSMSPETVEV